MSLALNPVTIASSGQSTLIIPGDIGQYSAIDLYNASIYDLKVSGLPQGTIWLPINGGVVLDPKNGLPAAVYFTPGQTTTLTPTPGNVVLPTVYLQGEGHPDYGPYVNTRYTNVGGSVVVPDITAQFLTGDGQALPLTELDTGAGNPMLLPANGASIALALGARDASNVAREIVDIGASVGNEFTVFKGDGSGNQGTMHSANILLTGQVQAVNSVFTAGNFGVSAVVKTGQITNSNLTTLQTVLTYTPAASGFFRINVTLRPVNATSPQNLTLQFVHGSAFIGSGTLTVNMIVKAANGATAVANGATGITTAGGNELTTQSESFYALAGSAITVSYRDPGGTPNDSVYAVLEQLA